MSNQAILFAEDAPAAYNPEQKEKDWEEVEELQAGEPMRRLRRFSPDFARLAHGGDDAIPSASARVIPQLFAAGPSKHRTRAH